MIRTARAWFRNSNTAIAVTVGVVGGYALHGWFQSLANGIVQPLIFDSYANGRDGTFSIGPLDIDYQFIVLQTFALLAIAAVAYTLFIWPGGEPIDEDPDTRECPECRSEIWSDATRCAFCTSAVTPQRNSDDDAEN